MSYESIASNFKRSSPGISKLIKKILTSGETKRKVGSGRPRKISQPVEKMMIHHATMELKKERKITCDSIKSYLEEMHEISVSTVTVSRVLNDSGEFQAVWQSKKPFVCERNRKKRLNFARKHKDWTSDDWARVLWSDESPFVYRYNRREKVWVLKRGPFRTSGTRATVKHDQKINIWGCFCRNGVGNLYFIKGIMKK